MSENESQTRTGSATTNGDSGDHHVEPCACCRALATKYVACVPAGGIPAGVSYSGEQPQPNAARPKTNRPVVRFPNIADLLQPGKSGSNGQSKAARSHRTGNGGATTSEAVGEGNETESGSTDGADESTPRAGELDEDELLKAPKRKHIFGGLDGIAVMVLGVALPLLMCVATVISCPKRLTLVILNHPLESLAELLLVLCVPMVNLSVWRSLCRHDTRFQLSRGLALGASVGTSLVVAGICVAALFWGRQDLETEIGSSFSAGFCWLSILAMLAASVSAYLINRFRLTHDFPNSRRWILAVTASGAVLALAAFAGAEVRSWTVRLAEQMAVSNSAKDRQEGLTRLRALDPERELRMECSDPRAAGLSGLFLPLKPSAQQELYFSVTGKPYSFRDANNSDFASMPDEYVSRNVVGDKITGLSLTRSSMTADVHPRTLSSTVHWTFVFKNETANPEEARAEMAVPPGAVVNGLTRWTNGEPQEASFSASGKVPGGQTWEEGHDSAAVLTDLGRGRVLLHCYPVAPAQQLKVDVSMVVPLKPDGKSSATMVMPKFLAANFDTHGEHILRMQSDLALYSTLSGLKQNTTPAKEHLLTGTLTDAQLEAAPIIIEASRPSSSPAVALLDRTAIQLQHEEDVQKEAERRRRMNESEQPNEQVVVMIDGSRVQDQLDSVANVLNKRHHQVHKTKITVVKPEYVAQSVEQISSPAPKHLVVVVDGSAAMSKHVPELELALSRIAQSIPVSVIIASQEQPKLMAPVSLADGLRNLKQIKFIGGQDNLQAVVSGAELAGETKDSAVLWIHGPQPTLNSNIYIMKQYVGTPKFYELALDSGDVDTYEFFKNHSEIGPFDAVPQDKSVVSDLTDFFRKWQPGNSGYTVAFSQTNKQPDKSEILKESDGRELLQLHAFQEVMTLIKSRHALKAAKIAVRYGILSPVSIASIRVNAPIEDLNTPSQAEEEAASVPKPQLQGATNGTIGPQGMDAKYITGVNSAGTVRVNNLANLEALLNIIANLAEIAGMLVGAIILIHGLAIREIAPLFGLPVELSPGVRMALGVAIILLALAVPGTINWFVASARDANLFN